MQSKIGPFLNQLGWISWVTNVDPPSTIFYTEYQNTVAELCYGPRGPRPPQIFLKFLGM